MTETASNKTPLQNKYLRTLALAAALTLLVFSIYGIFRSSQSSKETPAPPQRKNYQHQGKIDYSVLLRPNALYDTETLAPQAVFFTPLIDTFTVQYHYEFVADAAQFNPEFMYEAKALFGVEGVWQTEIYLVPPTKTEEETIDYSFALPLSTLLDYFDVFARETGSTLNEPSLDIIFETTPLFEIAEGETPEAFSQNFLLQINEKIIRPGQELTQEELKTITSNTPVTDIPKPNRQGQYFSIAGIILSLFSLAYLGKDKLSPFANKFKLFKQASNDEKDFRFAKKRLGGLLVETERIPAARADEETIQLTSLRDMVDLADETLRPVLYQQEKNGGMHFVILHSAHTRFEYTGNKPTIREGSDAEN